MYLDPQLCFVPLGVDLRGGAMASVQGGDEEAAVRGVPHHRHQAGTGAQEAAPQCQQSAQIPGTLHPSQNKLLQAPAPAEIPGTGTLHPSQNQLLQAPALFLKELWAIWVGGGEREGKGG